MLVNVELAKSVQIKNLLESNHGTKGLNIEQISLLIKS